MDFILSVKDYLLNETVSIMNLLLLYFGRNVTFCLNMNYMYLILEVYDILDSFQSHNLILLADVVVVGFIYFAS